MFGTLSFMKQRRIACFAAVFAAFCLFAGVAADKRPSTGRNADGNIVFVDLTERWLGPDGFVPKALMADGIHPTAEGYAIWGGRLCRELHEIERKQGK